MGRVKRVGPYKLMQELGGGAYGQVYKCIDTRNQEIRAIKKVELPRQPNPLSPDRSLRKEAEILKKFDSDYIIKCYGDMETENNYYIVLEYCDGGNLKAKIGVGETEALRYVRQIVSAMKAMYGQNILHRDIKPDNILLSNGVAKIGDFGTAKSMTMSERGLAGTLPYMAPEVRYPQPGQQYDVKVDVWSLGVLTYELITGQLPYDYEQLTEDDFYFKLIGKLNAMQDVSVPVKELLLRILQKQAGRISFEDLCDHPVITGPVLERPFPLASVPVDDANMDRAVKLMELAKREKVKHPFLLYFKVCQLMAATRDSLFLEAMKEAKHWIYRSDWESYTTDRLFIELAVTLCQKACRGLNTNMKENYEEALALLGLVKEYPFLQTFKQTIHDFHASFR